MLLLTAFSPKRAWLSLDVPDAERWLLNRIAQLSETMIQTPEHPNAVIFSQLLEQTGSTPAIVLVWRVADQEALDGIRSLLGSDEVAEYFTISAVGGPLVEDQDDIVRPFIDSLP